MAPFGNAIFLLILLIVIVDLEEKRLIAFESAKVL